MATDLSFASVVITAATAFGASSLAFRKQRVATHIEISKAFADLTKLAHARGKTELSPQAVDALLKFWTPIEGAPIFPRGLLDSCVVDHPVGRAQQDAAIATLGELGRRYAFLYQPALVALQSLGTGIPEVGPVVKAALQRLQSWHQPKRAQAIANACDAVQAAIDSSALPSAGEKFVVVGQMTTNQPHPMP